MANILKNLKKQRGRPRKFDSEEALTKAMNLFWQKGFSATSLDDLSAAMKMSRPSIYNAFGNKESIYHKSFELYFRDLGKRLTQALFAEKDIKIALQSYFSTLLEIHFGSSERLGCFIISTSPAEALLHQKIKDHLLEVIKGIDALLEKRLNQEPDFMTYSASSAKIIQAVMHSGSIRARAGESQSSIKKMYFDTIEALSRYREMIQTGGCCRCGAVRMQFKLPSEPYRLTPRACDCDFCVKRGISYLSDPTGRLIIPCPENLKSYKHGSEQASFLACNKCDDVVAAICKIGDLYKGAVNATLLTNSERLKQAKIVSPKSLSAKEKIKRWDSLWCEVEIDDSLTMQSV